MRKLFVTFTFNGKRHRYICHQHNQAWGNERTIEIPIIWQIVKDARGKKILEVGNVLSSYYCINHDILDKYEIAPGVINDDVVNFRPAKKYDLIVSISTLEHIGWDENPRVPKKILAAIDNLKFLLAPEGKIILTLPLGYNIHLDNLLKEDKIQFSERYYLKRISKDNYWKEVSREEAQDAKFNSPFPFANWLVIGIIEKNKRTPNYKNI